MPLYFTGDEIFVEGNSVSRAEDQDGVKVIVRITREAIDDYPNLSFEVLASDKYDSGAWVDQGADKPRLVTIGTTDVEVLRGN